jgi:hypothetical protein
MSHRVFVRNDGCSLSNISHSEVDMARGVSTMRGQWILDEDRSAPSKPPRLGVGVGIADHPASGEIDLEVDGSLQQHPRLRFSALATSRQDRVESVRMVQAVAVVVHQHSPLGEQANNVLMGFEKILTRDLSLGYARLIRDNHGTVIERPDTTNRVRRRGN